ncbi:protein ELYS-like isoform 1-T1 [Menidia menidia]
MLEGQWSEALTNNNIRAIICWLETLTTEGDAHVAETLPTFSCWVQRTAEFTKKEVLTLCFSRCQGLWMYLNRSAFSRINMLLQRLKNLLTLAQWARKKLCAAHFWHGVGVPCMICMDTHSSSAIRQDCWNREHNTLKQHIWLGQLIQWWGIMGLLPKFPDVQEVKRITQMWKEMDPKHRKVCLETPRCRKGETEQFDFLIEGMVMQLNNQHGCIWTSEDCIDECYPPPNLQALLKLVLVPHIDNMSIHAIFMYFILDVANFLQCKDNLLQSFCHAFTIPSSFSQQVRAFWLFDHGHIKASMELLLSPRATAPLNSWQHHCLINCLLTRKQPQMALRYLQWTRPAIETVEDAKLCADVLLQSSCVSDAWALLRRSHTESENMVMYFLQACRRFNLSTEALNYIPEGYSEEEDFSWILPLRMKDCLDETAPRPLSASLYHHQRESSMSSEQLVKLLEKAVMEMRQPHPKIREVVWPKTTEKKSKSRELFLSVQALRHLTPSPSPADMMDNTENMAPTENPEEQDQSELLKHSSSSESLSSVSASSFTSASSLPLLKHPYVYERTVTLQRISSLLTDGENQSSEEGEEEANDEVDEEEGRGTLSPSDFMSDCSKLIWTPDGAKEPVSLDSSGNEIVVGQEFSAEESPEKEDQSDSVFSATPDCFLETKINLEQPEHHQQVESLGPLSQDHSCSPSKTSLDQHTDLNWSFVLEEIIPGGSPGMCEQDSSISPTHLKITGGSLTLCPERNIKTPSALSAMAGEITLKSKLQTNELIPPNIPPWRDHWKAGGWWNQKTETHRISSNQLSAKDPGEMIGKDKDTSPTLQGPSYTCSLVSFMDLTAWQRDAKQAEKEELETLSGKAPQQGAIRRGRTRSSKGKRLRRT